MSTELPRRPFLGVAMREAGSEFADGGLEVAGVRANSLAQRARLRVGDRIAALGGVPTGDLASLRRAIAAIDNAARVTVSALRDGERLEVEVEVARCPTESLDGHLVSYGHVDAADGVKLRTIATEPARPGPHPGVLFVQGIRRGTVDLPSSPGAPIRELCHQLAARGFATMRLERRGVGDSQGGPFEALDFETEAADVLAALEAFRKRPAVDGDRVALFGHSTGGMVAPLIAGGGASRVVVYGTSSSRWFDCVRQSARNQLDVRGQADLEARLAQLEADIAAVRAGRGALFGRAPAFHQQLDNARLADAWGQLKQPLLILHGGFDWVVPADHGQALAALRAGLETRVVEIPNLDHAMTFHPSLESSVESYGRGPFGAIADAVGDWLGPAARPGSSSTTSSKRP